MSLIDLDSILVEPLSPRTIRRRESRYIFDRDTTIICLQKLVEMLREDGVKVFYTIVMDDSYYLHCTLYNTRQCMFEVGVPLEQYEMQSFVDDLNTKY
jgi:hypothetical protein